MVAGLSVSKYTFQKINPSSFIKEPIPQVVEC